MAHPALQLARSKLGSAVQDGPVSQQSKAGQVVTVHKQHPSGPEQPELPRQMAVLVPGSVALFQPPTGEPAR